MKDFGSARTLEEMQVEMQKLRDEAQSLRQKIEAIRSEKDSHRQRVNTLDKNVGDARVQLAEVKNKLEKTAALRSRHEELEVNKKHYQSIIQDVERQLAELAPEIGKATALLQDITSEGSEKERKQQAKASKLWESISQLKAADEEINHYELSGGAARLQRIHNEVKSLHEKLTELRKEAAEISSKINEYSEERSNTNVTEQNIKNNLRLREAKRELQRVREEIIELESHDAENRKEHYTADYHKLNKKVLKLTSDQAGHARELRTCDDQLKEIMREYETDYKTAKDDYRENMIRVTVRVHNPS